MIIRGLVTVGVILVSACAQEQQPEAIAPVRPNASRGFSMSARDRHLRGIETTLATLGFTDVHRFYEGPEYSLVSVRVAGSEAIPGWGRLRKAVSQTEAWPVIVGEVRYEGELREHLRTIGIGSVEGAIHLGEALDFDRWLTLRHSSDPDTYTLPRTPRWRRPFRTHCNMNGGFRIHTNLGSSKPYAIVSIVLVPTTEPWQVPAFLQFGGWNDCPLPEEHVSALRNWHGRFGAEPVGIGTDIVELTVAKPIADETTALEVAEEQFVYAHDIVHQGTNTIDCLADTINGASAWFFWWD